MWWTIFLYYWLSTQGNIQTCFIYSGKNSGPKRGLLKASYYLQNHFIWQKKKEWSSQKNSVYILKLWEELEEGVKYNQHTPKKKNLKNLINLVTVNQWYIALSEVTSKHKVNAVPKGNGLEETQAKETVFPFRAGPPVSRLRLLQIFLPSFFLPTHSFVLVLSSCPISPHRISTENTAYPLRPNKRKISSNKNVLILSEARIKHRVKKRS